MSKLIEYSNIGNHQLYWYSGQEPTTATLYPSNNEEIIPGKIAFNLVDVRAFWAHNTGITEFITTQNINTYVSGATVTPLTSTQIGFGDASNVLTGSSTFVYNDGDVGIGISSPLQKLDVFSNSPSSAIVRVTDNAGDLASWFGYEAYNDNANFVVGAIKWKYGSGYGDSTMKLQVADSSKVLQDRMQIDVNGNLTTNSQVIIAGATECAVIGGGENTINSTTADYSVITGGYSHILASSYSFIGGGYNHTMSSTGPYSAIVGGKDGYTRADFGFIGGGEDNTIYSYGNHSAIVGGDTNYIGENAQTTSTVNCFIGGGSYNTIKGDNGVILGSYSTDIETDEDFVVMLGCNNRTSVSSATTHIENLHIFGLTKTGTTVLVASGGTVDSEYTDEYEFVELYAGNKIVEITGTTFNVNDVEEYSEIIYIITTGCTITIDTDQLGRTTLLNFKNVDGITTTIETEGAETIDGETSQTISSYENMKIVSNNTNWYII